jgi:hypothetical protein
VKSLPYGATTQNYPHHKQKANTQKSCTTNQGPNQPPRQNQNHPPNTIGEWYNLLLVGNLPAGNLCKHSTWGWVHSERQHFQWSANYRNAYGEQSSTHGEHMTGGVPRRPRPYIRIITSLYMWFCDHSQWWGVWLVVSDWGHCWWSSAPPSEEGLTFRVVKWIFTYVCVCRISVG